MTMHLHSADVDACGRAGALPTRIALRDVQPDDVERCPRGKRHGIHGQLAVGDELHTGVRAHVNWRASNDPPHGSVSRMSDDELDQEDVDDVDELALAMDGEFCAAGYILILANAIERCDADIGVPLSAWENVMVLLDWALPKHVAGRLQGPGTVTTEDVDAMRRLGELGAVAIAGGDRSPELAALAKRAIQVLLGPEWQKYASRAENDARDLVHGRPPG